MALVAVRSATARSRAAGTKVSGRRVVAAFRRRISDPDARDQFCSA